MKNIITALFLLFLYSIGFADGIIISDNENYPGRILKNKSTNIEVNIEGLIVKTISIQEFQNEWNQTIDGVYSFPLPLNARVTRLMYSKGDTLIDAVLKVMPQTTNPGTGEGGLVAEINEYMGQNVIRLQLTNISPNSIKWVRLEYISELRHFSGVSEYSYPLDTEGFYSSPLDYLSVKINVHSEQNITGFEMPSHPDFTIITSTEHDVSLLMVKPLAYQATDIKFNYTVINPTLFVDLYSWNSDTTDGYFTLIGRPILKPTGFTFPTNIIFLIENSSTMIGEKLNQSKLAVIAALDELTPQDSFNIAYFNYTPHFWKTSPVVANVANIATAKTFVENITPSGGSDIGGALYYGLEQVENTSTTSSILTFTDGKGYLNPYSIETNNTNKTGIFFIAFTDKVDRHRLETTAMLNYGFVTYLDESSVLSSEMLKIFKKINRPVLKDVNITFNNPNVYDLYPTKFPAIYGDSDFKVTGRYSTSGDATVSIQAEGESGTEIFNFSTNFTSFSFENDNARCMWARDAIDEIESNILINGETDLLKADLIDISLREKIRCRYTAFVEDTVYSDFPDSIFTEGDDPISNVSINKGINSIYVFPNPIFDSFTINIENSEFVIDDKKIFKIFDISGKLIFSYNFSNFEGEVFQKTMNKSIFNDATGLFLVSIEINDKIIETKTIIVAKE